LLDDNGLFVVEVQDSDRLFIDNQFDTIYREHVCYFSRTTLSYLCSLVGLNVIACKTIPIHNGSIRLTAKKTITSSPINPSISSHPTTFVYDTSGFSSSISSIKSIVHNLLAQNKKIAAYGASGRCTNILCLSDFDSSHISAVFDSSESKIGLYIPTTDIPILAKNYVSINSFDCILISAWNYSDQIIQELRSDYSFSGQLVIPLPIPHIIS
jgi:novobiocin biosynthesis protein NovU